MPGGIFVYQRVHFHRCHECDGDFQCYCLAPEKVEDYVCEECREEE